jgi:hypothetical protein
VYLFMLRRWVHNSIYTDVANPHNRIDDVSLAAGVPVVVYGVVEYTEDIMTEAQRDGCNVLDRGMSIPLGILIMTCDACAT